MDLHHSPPRKRSKSFHTTCQDTAQFAHPVHAETDPMDIDRPGHVTQDSTTMLASTGATAANSGILHHEENDLSPEELRVEVKDLVALADKMKLEIHMNLPWRDFVSLAKATAPLRDAGFQLSVTFNEEEWSDIPSQYRDFHKALAVKAITGAELDAANLRFQQDMPEFIADQLTARGTHGYRPNKRR
ncbi:hypothetical protein LB506_006103 [Fusarium annulatum]|nr:hypothetical protein LB506_006103 [Fusarium annulatum]